MNEVFVGREAELAGLRSQLRQVMHGSPSVVLVEGAAGDGKTALLSRFVATMGGVRQVWASGDEAETAIAYGVYDQIRAGLARHESSGRSSTRSESSTGAGRDLQTAGETLVEELLTVARGRCLLVVIDDAHLADRPSLAALSYGLRRLQTDSILTVVASRPEGTARMPAGLLRLVDAHGARISLSGFSVAEVGDLATHYGHRGVGERAARRLRDHTGGSPLHLRALLQDGRLDDEDWLAAELPTPLPFARLVADQLEQLSAEARRLVGAAAVLGLRCSLGMAAEMAGVASPLATADELHARRLANVVKSQFHGMELIFDHSLIRAAVVEAAGPARQAALHLAAGQVTRGVEALFHRAAGTAGPDLALAAELGAVADADTARGSWRTASDAYLEAARLHPQDENRGAMLLRAVYALLVAGDLAVAGIYRARVAELPATARRLQVQALMAWMDGDFAAAEASAVQGWSLASDLDPLERDRLAGLLAQMCIMQGKSAAAKEWSQTALDSGLLDSRGRASTLATLVGATMLEVNPERALTLLPTEGDLNDAGYRELVGMRGIVQLMTDDAGGAAANLRIRLRPNLVDHTRGQSPIELLTATGADGIEPNKMVILLFLAEAEYRRGLWDVAAAIADQALVLIDDTEQYWVAPWAHAVAALVPASRGRWDDAESQLALAEEMADRVGGELNHGYATNAAVHVAACRGDAERVVAAARWLLEDGKPFQQEPGLHCWPVHYAEALVTLGRYRQADEVLGQWEAAARARRRRSRMAALARVRGDLAARQRDLTTARQAYQLALDVGDDESDALERAELFVSRGRFLRRRGERRAAVRDLREAERRLNKLGAEPFLDVVRAELAACGIEFERTVAAPDPVMRLTPQENAVARLAAAGRSNKDIAEELVLSPKTVAYHLGHVFDKLGVRSRAQLAAIRPFDFSG